MSAREAEERILDFLRISSEMKTSLHADTRDTIAAVASAAGEATVRASDLEAIVTEVRRLRNIEARLVKIGASVVLSKREAAALGETTERLGMRAVHQMSAALGREAIRVASIGSVRTADGSIEHRGYLYAVRPGATS